MTKTDALVYLYPVEHNRVGLIYASLLIPEHLAHKPMYISKSVKDKISELTKQAISRIKK